MDTVSHGLWAYLLSNGYRRLIPKYFVLGAVAPDGAILFFAAVMLLTGQLPLHPPWLVKIYSHPWVPFIDSIFHSVIFWSVALGVAILFSLKKLYWLVMGSMLHLAIDIVTHIHFLPAYLYPLYMIPVKGIVDYRTTWFTVVDVSLLACALGVYWYKKRYSLKGKIR